MFVEGSDQRDGCAADARGHSREIVERLLWGRVQNLMSVQRCDALDLIVGGAPAEGGPASVTGV